MEAGKRPSMLWLLLVTGLAAASLFVSTDAGRIHRDTEAAMEEVTQLFRSLFPLVPERTQYFWKSNQLGSAMVLNDQRASRGGDSSSSSSSSSSGDVIPWRLEIDFRKRGPDCMRKCIAQGVLHPVQCHSLC